MDNFSSEISLDKLMMLSERLDQLAKIWPQLSWEDQFLLEGKYILGYNNQELAEKLLCKPSSIRMKLTRTRRSALSLLLKLEGVDHYDEA